MKQIYQQGQTPAIWNKIQKVKTATTYNSCDDTNVDSKEQDGDLGIRMCNTATQSEFMLEI